MAFIKARPIPDKLIRNLQKAPVVPENSTLYSTSLAGALARRIKGHRLLKNEKEVLYLASCGIERKESACYLGLSPHTVEKHLSNARIVLEAKTTTHAVAIAFREGLII